MMFNKTAVFVCSLLLAGAMAGCATLPASMPTGSAENAQVSIQPALKARYAELVKNGGRVLSLDPQRSLVRIYVFRAGAAAKLGHNHVGSAPRFAGFVYLPPTGTAEAQFDLEFRLDELEIDNPAYRSLLGKAFVSVPTAADIAGTRAHMLSVENMQADRFPFVRVHSLRVAGESPKLAVDVQVEMHGKTREIRVPLSLDGLPDHLTVSGAFTLRQTDFGVQPYSVLGGLIAVADEVVIEFNLAEANGGKVVATVP